MWMNKAKLKGSDVFMGEDYAKVIEKKRAELLPIMKLARSIDKYKLGTYLSGDKLVVDKRRYSVDELEQLPHDLNPRFTSTITEGEVTYFYTKHSPLSNHFPAMFTIGEKTYCCSEQCYFAAKAEFMGDFDQLAAIMRQKDGSGCLTEGKKIKNLTNKNWDEAEEESMKKANREKFNQNLGLKAFLMSTENRMLAEASLYDKRWGIGYSLRSEGKEQQLTWGDNKMGKCLMFLRHEFAQQQPMIEN
jgi:hypothetical protein